MPRGWLLLLMAVLLVWMPMTVAGELNATLGSIAMRGPAAVVELLVHAAVASVAVAAGWALGGGRPHAILFAKVALVASAACSVQSLYWSALPRQTIPGDRMPLAVLTIVHAVAWLTYLHRSRRARAIDD